MEKNQYELCTVVLQRLEKAGVLEHFILIGSWSLIFYQDYFKSANYRPLIRTRDVDFLIPSPQKIKTNVNVNVPNLFQDLGFVIDLKGSDGYIQLQHPNLMIEFLVAEQGRGIDKPYPLPQFGLNAQTIRFLNLLSDKTIKVKFQNFYLTLPHPINWALQKLIIFQRRANVDKSQKDQDAAIYLLNAIIENGEGKEIRNTFESLPSKWQSKILAGLHKIETKSPDLSGILKWFDIRKV